MLKEKILEQIAITENAQKDCRQIDTAEFIRLSKHILDLSKLYDKLVEATTDYESEQ